MVEQMKEGMQPRKLLVRLPPVKKGSNGLDTATGIGEGEDMLGGLVLQSKEAAYEQGNYRLNFQGRVKVHYT